MYQKPGPAYFLAEPLWVPIGGHDECGKKEGKRRARDKKSLD